MNTKHFWSALTVSGFATLALSVSCADQPKPKCYAGHGEFAARLTPTGTSAANPACNLRIETFGVAAYNDRGENGAPNLDSVPVAIQPVSLAMSVQRLKTGALSYNIGKFKSSVPDDNDLCYIDSTNEVTLDLPAYAGKIVSPEIPEAEEGEEPSTELACAAVGILPRPAQKITYSWSNLQFYVTATAAGTQFKGDLKVNDNGVECTYSTVAVYPAISCGTDVAPAEGGNCRDTTEDPTVCDKNPNVNPDFVISCATGNDLDISQARVNAAFVPTKFICAPAADSFPALVK